MNNLDAYLSEIKKFPVLRTEEARALIQELPDQDAEKKLTEGYLLLAYKIAEKHTKILGDIDLIHLIKWANYGLFDALQHHVALLKKSSNPDTYIIWIIGNKIAREYVVHTYPQLIEKLHQLRSVEPQEYLKYWFVFQVLKIEIFNKYLVSCDPNGAQSQDAYVKDLVHSAVDAVGVEAEQLSYDFDPELFKKNITDYIGLLKDINPETYTLLKKVSN